MTSIDENIINVSREIPLPTVEVVAIKDDKILILKRQNTNIGNGLWWIPGGRVLYGETMDVSVMRILFCETGLMCKILRQLPSRDYFLDGYHSIGTPFIVEITSENGIVLDDSHSEYGWFTKSDIKELDKHPSLNRIIEEVFA